MTIQTFDLTDKELYAARILTKDALAGMGGKRPSDFENDEFTWTDLEPLMEAGLSRHEAAGVFGALVVKGFIRGQVPQKGRPAEAFITTAGWRWLDTVWDKA